MLKKRIITGIILITVVLLVLFYLPPAAFCILTAFIMLAAAWEWAGLMNLTSVALRLAYVVLMAFMIFGALFVPAPLILFVAVCWWLLTIPLILFYPLGSRWFQQNKIIRGGMGLITLIPAWAAINFIRNQNDGIFALLFLFVLVWGADTAAYFTGKKWGTAKMLPLVSPAKSWQGLAGALIFTLMVTLGVLLACHTPLALWVWGMILALITVIFSVVGDLFESLLKRQANVKDSGNLLPGHGGVLDRIDSLTAAAPLFAFSAWVLGTYLY